jgi:hypothetical protein
MASSGHRNIGGRTREKDLRPTNGCFFTRVRNPTVPLAAAPRWFKTGAIGREAS